MRQTRALAQRLQCRIRTDTFFDHGCIPAALDLTTLDAASQAAAAAFVAAGTAENMRSYRSALTYWTAWLQGRYGQPLGDASLPVAVVVQFVLDHLACPQDDGAGRTFCRLHWIRLCWPPGHADAIIFWFPTQKSVFDAIWDIIDHNGLVRRVNLPQVEPAPGVNRFSMKAAF